MWNDTTQKETIFFCLFRNTCETNRCAAKKILLAHPNAPTNTPLIAGGHIPSLGLTVGGL
jgi:hypothetical protein